MKLTAIVLLLALPSWAQHRQEIIPVKRAAIMQADGGVVGVEEGVWFSTDEVMRMGADHADLRTQNEHLREHAADTPYKWLVLVGGAGIVLGTVVGFFAARAVPR